MIEAIIDWSLRNRFLVILSSILITLGGIYALKNTPVDAIPDLSDVQVIIKTSYKGQAPQVVEDQVTYPLATAMLAVPKAMTVRGYSFFGDSYVYVLFSEGTDPYWARSRVLEYLNQVSSQLPDGAKPSLGPDATGVGWVYQYALIDKTGKHDLSELTSIQNWFLKYELQTLPGVSEVATMGGMVKQYQVTLNPNRLRNYGLTLAKVKSAIKNANQEVGGSVVEMAEAEYMVRTSGYLKNLQSLKEIPLKLAANGVAITLQDVADIGLGPEMRRGIVEYNGEGETVGATIVMRQGENALKTIDAVKSRLTELKSSLPEGVEIVEVYDRSTLIHRAIDTLKEKLTEETLIVIFVCALFLFHLRSSLVVVITLPLAIVMSFIVMYLQGINANIMSLGGIAIAIGAMTDAAIVMIENMHKHLERDNNPDANRWKIVAESAKEVGKPLFFSLLIITLSFLPVFTLEAQEGKLFSPLAFTKTYAMAASAILSITLVPVLMGYFIRGKIIPEHKNPSNRMLIAAFKPVVEFSLARPKSVLITMLALVILTAYPLSKIGSEFMPELDEGDWMYMPTTLPGISIGKARELLQQTDKLIKTVPEVRQVFGKIGRAQSATDPAPLTMIETVIQFKPKSEWRPGITPQKIKDELNQAVKIPGVTNAWVMPIKTRIDMLATGIKTPIGIKVNGDDLNEIQAVGQEVEKVLNKVKGTASVFADRAAGGRYITVDINRKQAARFGLNISDVQSVIMLAVGGMNVSQTIEGRERYPINVRYPQASRDSIEKLKFLPITTKSGAQIPLADVANVKVEDGPPVIKSENAKLTGWVLVDIDKIDIGSYIMHAKQAIKDNIKLPAGISLTWSGQYEYMQRAKAKLMVVGPVTLLVILLLLYINFRRFAEVMLILLTLPLALTGGLWFIYWLGYNLSVAVGVGFIALAGVAVEIGVIMLVYLNQALSNQGQVTELVQIRKAVIEGALLRVRPIIMTVATIVIGLMPVMLGTGTGAEVMRRIAAPMVGGMISATILTLMVIPAIYFLWKSKTLSMRD